MRSEIIDMLQITMSLLSELSYFMNVQRTNSKDKYASFLGYFNPQLTSL